ncbi:Aggrecan core protein [Actinoplanes sp. SE50]|nr:Aggrecan core protein [Actinoplanes sp. SE50/110]ATO80920.1 Aggrecan core protein [Actinoplanes sp. SE50]SLL98327.1 uncharacterized protein ACSP50_1553 [Actinoplanes sp. SE50/110]
MSGVAATPPPGIAPVSGIAATPPPGIAPVSGIAATPAPGIAPVSGIASAPVSGMASGGQWPVDDDERNRLMDTQRIDFGDHGVRKPVPAPESFAGSQPVAVPEPITAPDPVAVQPPVTQPPVEAPRGASQPVAVPEPAATEPRGLGWLLSMSGLGAEMPVPETSPLAAPEETVVVESLPPTGWFAPSVDDEEPAVPEAPDSETPSSAPGARWEGGAASAERDAQPAGELEIRVLDLQVDGVVDSGVADAEATQARPAGEDAGHSGAAWDLTGSGRAEDLAGLAARDADRGMLPRAGAGRHERPGFDEPDESGAGTEVGEYAEDVRPGRHGRVEAEPPVPVVTGISTETSPPTIDPMVAELAEDTAHRTPAGIAGDEVSPAAAGIVGDDVATTTTGILGDDVAATTTETVTDDVAATTSGIAAEGARETDAGFGGADVPEVSGGFGGTEVPETTVGSFVDEVSPAAVGSAEDAAPLGPAEPVAEEDLSTVAESVAEEVFRTADEPIEETAGVTAVEPVVQEESGAPVAAAEPGVDGGSVIADEDFDVAAGSAALADDVEGERAGGDATTAAPADVIAEPEAIAGPDAIPAPEAGAEADVVTDAESGGDPGSLRETDAAADAVVTHAGVLAGAEVVGDTGGRAESGADGNVVAESPGDPVGPATAGLPLSGVPVWPPLSVASVIASAVAAGTRSAGEDDNEADPVGTAHGAAPAVIAESDAGSAATAEGDTGSAATTEGNADAAGTAESDTGSAGTAESDADAAGTTEGDAGSADSDAGDADSAGEVAALGAGVLGGEVRDGGASGDVASAGAGPASGDAHDTSEPGSTAAHHHGGTGPAFALADDTTPEASAAVSTIVAETAADGTDSESAPGGPETGAETAEIVTPAPAGPDPAPVDTEGVPDAEDALPADAHTGHADGGTVGSSERAAAADDRTGKSADLATGDRAEEAGPAPEEDRTTEADPEPREDRAVEGDPEPREDRAVEADPAPEDIREKAADAASSRESPAAAADPAPVTGRTEEADEAPIRQRREQRAPADRRRADPEEILAAYPWMFDPRTLREQVDEPDRLWDLSDRLTDRLEFAERDNVRAGLLSLRAVVGRVLGELDDALADGRAGLRHAEASGEARTVAVARARLAHVLQWRGEFAEADRLYAEADSAELPARVRAEIRELAGRSAFEQGRFLEAVNHFERALDLCRDSDAELVERVEVALDVMARRSGDGWGPYPRSREQLLNLPPAPTPLRDDGTGLWGYAAAVEPRYAQAQPFAEGVAWVRRPDSPAWELIDASGAVLIGADSGYRDAGKFAEGLAWVSREAEGGWVAIDRGNRLIVPGGFEEARPFRRGLALIRRGGWGAVDKHGRIVVQPKYRQFSTVLSAGGPIDGFSDEGFAVVDAGTGAGVVDRTGQPVLPPVHRAVVLHPSAFLIADEAGRWGALDRQGRPLVETRHTERADAVAEVLRLKPDSRPVL